MVLVMFIVVIWIRGARRRRRVVVERRREDAGLKPFGTDLFLNHFYGSGFITLDGFYVLSVGRPRHRMSLQCFWTLVVLENMPTH